MGGVGFSTADSLTVHNGLAVTGVVTATSFVGNGSNLTGLANTSFINAEQVTVVGVVTATSFNGNLTGTASTATAARDAYGLAGAPGVDVGLTTVTGLDGVAYVAITTTATSKTIVNREYVTAVGVGTTAGITITLPASPTVGHEVGVAIAGTFTDTVIARNSSKIMALDEDMTLDRAYIAVQFVYVDSTVGWRFF